MNDFINNVRAVAISYGDKSRETNFTLLQRRAYDVFFNFLNSGAIYKKNSIKWFLCKYWLYSNAELQELYFKKYHKRINANTLNVTRHGLCKSLDKVLGDSFFDTFCEYEDSSIADEMAKQLIKHIKTLELHDEKFASLFIDAVLCVDVDVSDEAYEVDELKGELNILREYTNMVLEGKLSRIDKSKLAYIRKILNSETIIDGVINEEKMDMLKTLLWG